MKDIGNQRFSHICRNGTQFQADRCDFASGIIHYIPATTQKDYPQLLAADVAEMIGFHAVNIWPNLNGFQGYDCLRFVICP
jgi:hypothetical protein